MISQSQTVFKSISLSHCPSLSITPVNLSPVFLSVIVNLCLFVILSSNNTTVHWRRKEMNKKKQSNCTKSLM